jgi:hypothetical protein
MTTIPKTAGRPKRSTTVSAQRLTNQQEDTTMKLVRHVQLLNEALSRARTRRPQTTNSEAIRPARQIMVNSRQREHDRLLGL